MVVQARPIVSQRVVASHKDMSWRECVKWRLLEGRAISNGAWHVQNQRMASVVRIGPPALVTWLCPLHDGSSAG